MRGYFVGKRLKRSKVPEISPYEYDFQVDIPKLEMKDLSKTSIKMTPQAVRAA